MPPKKPDKKAEKGQQKADEKKKQKVTEDKTFGLKNKNKSKAVQKYIKGVQAQSRPNQKSEQALIDDAYQQREQRKQATKEAALLNQLVKGTENVKSIAVAKKDPKTVREEQKIDVYVDQRTMDSWNQEKLEEVINSKHGAQNANSTDIICKHFLDAVERRQYGWFWTCPNEGDSCKYRHCLPPGFVLKPPPSKDDEEEEEEEPLEEIIERERAALPHGGTQVTLESLMAWKVFKEEVRQAAVEEKRVAESKKTGGRGLGALTGRDLFIFDPTLFIDDEGAASENDYEEDEESYVSEGETSDDRGEATGGESDNKAVDDGQDNSTRPSSSASASAGDSNKARSSRPGDGSSSSAAPSSSSAACDVPGAAIQNVAVFVDGADLPDDLDDLDD